MNKAILVIDMPACCRECPLCGEDHMTYRDYCRITDEHIWTLDKPDWCPLKLAPQEQEIWYEDEKSEWERGYNHCVREILGDIT